jgi:hypothetical protein
MSHQDKERPLCHQTQLGTRIQDYRVNRKQSVRDQRYFLQILPSERYIMMLLRLQLVLLGLLIPAYAPYLLFIDLL